MPNRLPTLYLSHGSPDVLLRDTSARRFMAALGQVIERPRAVLVASAHFLAGSSTIAAGAAPGTIHDFGGFPDELYRMSYPAPGAPELGDRIVGLFEVAGIPLIRKDGRGYDHGTWMPLKLLYPEADLPVVQIAIEPRRDPRHHFALGRALAELPGEGVLVIGSGAISHNLSVYFRNGFSPDTPVPDWVTAFTDWFADRVDAGAGDDLLDYREKAPFAADNHPTDEHLLPFFVAMGAAGEPAAGRRIHHSVDYAVIGMDAYAFS